jgi:predicted negative regulator of RcsB-dependent stress response
MQKALAKNPAARFKTARELASEFTRVTRPTGSSATPNNRETVATRTGKSHTAMYGWILAVVLVLVVLSTAGLWIWNQRQASQPTIARCTSIETCERNARLLATAGRPLLSMETYQRAISLVPASDQTANAKLHCDLGDAYALLNKKPDARIAFKECINWTHDDASLESLRQYAQKRIKELK